MHELGLHLISFVKKKNTVLESLLNFRIINITVLFLLSVEKMLEWSKNTQFLW